MNQGIPKPLRNALARQVGGDVHPSPDVLTAFVERALPAVENEVVAHHLAECADCREIVFLASDAADDEVRDERELVAPAATRVPPLPVYVASSRPIAAPAEKSRPRWTIWMRWGMSIAAVALIVVAGLVLQFWRVGGRHNAAPITVANNRSTPANTEAQQTATAPSPPQTSAKGPVPEMLEKSAPHRMTAAHAGRVPAQTTVAGNDQLPSVPAAESARPATSSPATGVIGGVLGPSVRLQSSFAGNETGQVVQRGAPLEFAKPQMGMFAVHTVRPQWRIGPDGHLERSMGADQWTRVLDDRPITFHAVAVVGNDVWAGGNAGALFHSPDGGDHWSKVSLAANSKVDTGAIVAIHFDDSQNGVVASGSGRSWATTDGGVTWTTQ